MKTAAELLAEVQFSTQPGCGCDSPACQWCGRTEAPHAEDCEAALACGWAVGPLPEPPRRVLTPLEEALEAQYAEAAREYIAAGVPSFRGVPFVVDENAPRGEVTFVIKTNSR